MNPETTIQNKIRLKLSKLGILNFRNNTFAIKDPETGRLIRGGLAVGSSDLICCKPVLITPDMIGQTIGQFVAIEVKCPGKKPTKDQVQFGKTVKAHGGEFIVACHEDEV